MIDKKQILKQLTILYAEDEKTTRENITKTLKLFVNDVIAVEDGAEAIAAFSKKQVHIVILDYVMPIIDGNSVARSIREKNPHIPIIMLTSHSDKEKLLSAIKTGVNDYLEKPPTLETLMNALFDAVQKIINSGMLMQSLAEGVEYDYIQKAIHTNSSCERLTKQEYQFLEILLARPMSLVIKEEIEERVFGSEVEPNTLRNMVYRLRKKIPADVIVTIKDLGFMVRPL